MKYFRICCEKNGNVVPCILNWMEGVDYHTIQSGAIGRLPNRTLLYVDGHPELCFTDVISTPCLMISKRIWEVMKQYEESLQSRQIILLDVIQNVAEQYYIPIFRQSIYPEEEGDWISSPPFFQEGNITQGSLIGRLDFVESILRRGAKGIHIEEYGGENHV